MSEGFHRSFEPEKTQPLVGLFPVRRTRGRLEVWGCRPEGEQAACPHLDDGELAVARAPMAGETAQETAGQLVTDLAIGSLLGSMAMAGRWETGVSSPRRHVWELFVGEVGKGPDIAGGEWKDALGWFEAYEKGLAYPGPLFLCFLESIAGGAQTPEEIGAVLADRKKEGGEIRAAPGLVVLPLLTPTLPPATHTNCVIVGEGSYVVIDPASPYPEEQERLQLILERKMAAGERLSRIVLTHHHEDHVGGVKALQANFDVPVAAHPVTAERLRGRILIDEFLEDGDTISFGTGRFLRVMHTPGHARGHVILHEDTAGWSVVGDMVAGQGTIVIDPPEGNMADYLSQLERMKACNFRMMIPAHGGVIVNPMAWLEKYIAHRHWREGVILDAIEERGSLTIPAIVPHAYGDVNPMIYPIAARQVEAHLEKLEAEGRLIRELGPRFRTPASDEDPH